LLGVGVSVRRTITAKIELRCGAGHNGILLGTVMQVWTGSIHSLARRSLLCPGVYLAFGSPLTFTELLAERRFRARALSMSRELGKRCKKIAFVDAAETGKAAGAVDQDLIPDAAGVPVNHQVSGKIVALPGQVIDDVLGIVGDASALAMIDDGDNIAVTARLYTELGSLTRDLNLIIVIPCFLRWRSPL
jgi:hypothetical protein